MDALEKRREVGSRDRHTPVFPRSRRPICELDEKRIREWERERERKRKRKERQNLSLNEIPN